MSTHIYLCPWLTLHFRQWLSYSALHKKRERPNRRRSSRPVSESLSEGYLKVKVPKYKRFLKASRQPDHCAGVKSRCKRRHTSRHSLNVTVSFLAQPRLFQAENLSPAPLIFASLRNSQGWKQTPSIREFHARILSFTSAPDMKGTGAQISDFDGFPSPPTPNPLSGEQLSRCDAVC